MPGVSRYNPDSVQVPATWYCTRQSSSAARRRTATAPTHPGAVATFLPRCARRSQRSAETPAGPFELALRGSQRPVDLEQSGGDHVLRVAVATLRDLDHAGGELT